MSEKQPDDAEGIEWILDRLERELERAYERQQEATKEVERLKQGITALKPAKSEGPAASHTSESFPLVRPGQWKGVSKSTALGIYLQDCSPHKVLISRVATDLLKAGVHPGDKRGNQEPVTTMTQNLKITIRNNSPRFEYDPDAETVRIRPGITLEPPRHRNKRTGS